jgi:hypothetical protein
MDRIAALCLLLPALAAPGCVNWVASRLPPTTVAPMAVPVNSIMVPVLNQDQVWEQVVDVVDDFFKIQREERVRLIDNILTEGRIDTYPRTGSTFFEPWNTDSVTPYERLESTLQSIRRQAVLRVIPTAGGYQIEVLVTKELEDVARPESVTLSAGNLRNDNSVQRYATPARVSGPATIGWIPLGRDYALEQEILAQIQARFPGAPTALLQTY